MLDLKKGQKLYVLTNTDEFGNYSNMRTDVIQDIYTDENGTQMIEFTYLFCDIPVSEVGVSVFVDEISGNAELKKHLVKYKKIESERKEKEFQEKYKKYKAAKTFLGLNSIGIGIIDIKDDYCINDYIYGATIKRGKNKIYTDTDGRKYIVKLKEKFYLDTFKKVNK